VKYLKYFCQLRLTADKRKIKDFPKLLSATSFIRKTLGAIFIKTKRRYCYA